MRPLLIPLLLLYTLLAVTDAKQKCDKSLINEGTGAELDFYPNNIKCRESHDHYAQAIKFNSVLYDHLKCDETEGWSGVFGNGTSNVIAKADSPLTLTCTEYCAMTRSPRRIRRPSAHEITAECWNDRDQLFNGEKRVRAAKVYCGLDDGWYTKNEAKKIRLEHDHTKTLQLECRSDCDLSYIKGVTADEIAFKSVGNWMSKKTELSCRSNNNLKVVVLNSTRYDSLICDENEGWKSLGLSADAELTVACEEYCAVTGAGITFKTLASHQLASAQCGPEELLFHGEQRIADDLACDVDQGWFTTKRNDAAERTRIDHDHTKPLQLECKPACDLSLINGVSADEITYMSSENGRKILSCKSNGNSLKAIVFNSARHTSLVCEGRDGWTSLGLPSEAQLTVACEEYCAIAGTGFDVVRDDKGLSAKCTNEMDRIYYGGLWGDEHVKCTLDGWKDFPLAEISKPLQLECKPGPCAYQALNKKIKYDAFKREMICDPTYDDRIMHIEINLMQFQSLTCVEKLGWRGSRIISDGRNKWTSEEVDIPIASTPAKISCLNYCQAQDEREYHITYKKKSEKKEPYREYVEVTCKFNTLLFYGENQRLYVAKCIPEYGWYTETSFYSDDQEIMLRRDTTSEMEFKCRKDPPQCSYTAALHLHFDSDTKTLSCRGGDNKLMMIEHNSNRYHSITCDKSDGWMGKDAERNFGYGTLEVTCVEYCTTTGRNFPSDKTANGRRDIDCKHLPLIINSEKVDASNSAKCTMEDGWWIAGKQISKNATSPLKLDCRAACTPDETADILSFVNTSAIGRDSGMKEFECNKNTSAVKLNGEFVHAPLKCHPKLGYVNAAGEKLANTFDAVKLECEPAPPPCSLKKWEGPEAGFASLLYFYRDRNPFWLMCHNGLAYLTTVKYKSDRSNTFTCNLAEGWRVAGQHKIAEASIPLAATCEPYCEVAAISNGVDFKILQKSVVVSCHEKSNHLFINGKDIGSTATCDGSIGWHTGKYAHAVVFGKDTTRPMQFECRDSTVPPKPARTTPTTAPSRPEMYNPSNSSTHDFIYHPPATTMASVAEAATGDKTLLIVGGCVGGVLLIIGVIVILKLFVFKKMRPERRPESSGNATSRRATEKGKGTKRSGSNSNKSTRSDVGSVRSEQKS